jgi:hypothetical protein
MAHPCILGRIYLHITIAGLWPWAKNKAVGEKGDKSTCHIQINKIVFFVRGIQIRGGFYEE